MRNDIHSFRREIAQEEEIDNGVPAVQRFLGCSPQQAADIVAALPNARMNQFEHSTSVELPTLFGEHGLDSSVREPINGYVQGLRQWMAGDHQWSSVTGRYQNTGQPSARPSAGCSAAPRGSARPPLVSHRNG